MFGHVWICLDMFGPMWAMCLLILEVVIGDLGAISTLEVERKRDFLQLVA